MSNQNSWSGDGRLVRDPELKPTKNSHLCTFAIANETGWGDNKKTNFFEVKIWGKQAEFVAQYFKKGDGINLNGQLEQETWEKDGAKRSKIVIKAQQATFPISRPSGAQGGVGIQGGATSQNDASKRFSATSNDLPDF